MVLYEDMVLLLLVHAVLGLQPDCRRADARQAGSSQAAARQQPSRIQIAARLVQCVARHPALSRWLQVWQLALLRPVFKGFSLFSGLLENGH